MVTWGDVQYGGDSSAVTEQLASGVSEIFSTYYAFTAIKSDGSLVPWGSASNGGSGAPAFLSFDMPTLYVRISEFSPLGELSGDLQITGGNISKTLPLRGEVVENTNPTSMKFIIGGQQTAEDTFTVGSTSSSDENYWPRNESPDKAFDGLTTNKYLNFTDLGEGIGVIFTPVGIDASKPVLSLSFWTANDASGRDPASYTLYGSTSVLNDDTPGTTYALSDLQKISSGRLYLPYGRNQGPTQLFFDNDQAYSSYLLVFNSRRNPAYEENSVQVAEILPGFEPKIVIETSVVELSQFETEVGSPSLAQQVTVTGNTGENYTVTAPLGYELSEDGTTFSTSLTLLSETETFERLLYVRLSANALPGVASNALIIESGESSANVWLDGVVNGLEVSTDAMSGFAKQSSTASAAQQLQIAAFTGETLTVTAPDGYEISTDGENYANSLIFNNRAKITGESNGLGTVWTVGEPRVFWAERAFAALQSDGSVVTWGDADRGGDSSSVASSLSSGVKEVYPNAVSFAALKLDGSVVTWGDADRGGDSSSVASSLSSGVTEIFSNGSAFAALKSDGSVVTWGAASQGGDSSAVAEQLASGVTAVFSTPSAFAALKADGSVVTWGDVTLGADSSAVAEQITSGVLNIQSTTRAFAALKSDGSVVTWGDADRGGDSSGVAEQLSSGVVQVFSTDSAFAALKGDGSVVTWGASQSGDSSSVSQSLASGVTGIYSTAGAFAALKSDGSVIVWGTSSGGNSDAVGGDLLSGVVKVFANRRGFAAIKSDGSVVSWGNVFSPDEPITQGVVRVYSNESAFAALKSDGSVVTWGSYSFGGNSSAVSEQLASDVVAIYSTRRAFAALKKDGTLVAWGDSTYGASGAPSRLQGLSPSLYVRLAADATPDKVNGNLSIVSGERSATVGLSGSIVDYDLSVSELSGFVTESGRASAAKSFVLSGFSSASFTVTAPAGYEVSLNGSSYHGNVELSVTESAINQRFYVRLTAQVPTIESTGILTVSASGIEETIALSGLRVIGGQQSGANTFTVGGVDAGDKNQNRWPSIEGPANAFDNDITSKYLNFTSSGEGVGLFFSPCGVDSDDPVVSLSFWTANDKVNRDPASYTLYGSSTLLTGNSAGTAYALGDLQEIVTDTLELPATRESGPVKVSFANNQVYPSYLLVFNSRKGSEDAVQIGEILPGFVAGGLKSSDLWRLEHFGTMENSGDAADLAAPDGDGVSNLVKYGLVIPPGRNAAESLPKAKNNSSQSGSPRLSLTLTRDPSRNDIEIIVEALSGGLSGTWVELARSSRGGAFTGPGKSTEKANANGTVECSIEDISLEPNVPAERFMRVRVERSSAGN